MRKAAESRCAICLESRTDSDGWFLLTENRWTDRLKILGWDDRLAVEPGVYSACGAEHVQQLVIHWMAVGTLDYPFARASAGEKRPPRRRATTAEPGEPDTRGMKVFGELAVHRESLERILSESPESLGSILMALISALGTPASPAPTQEEEKEEELTYALT